MTTADTGHSAVIDVGAIRMRYLEQGTGPAVVMCHGFPGLGDSWRHQLPALAEAGFRAIAVDIARVRRHQPPAGSGGVLPHSYGRRYGGAAGCPRNR